MNFERYKLLARSVFPQLPAEFESMPDEMRTYQVVFNHCCPADPIDKAALSDMERVNLFSLSNMTETQMRHFNEFGRSFWKKDKVKSK